MNLYTTLFQSNFREQLTKRGHFKVQAPIKGGKFGAKLTHLCGFSLDVSFFSHVKKHRSRFWLGVSFFVFWFSFLPVKNIVRSWLASTHLCMTIYLIAELWRAKRACGAPWVSKSTHPRKFGNHVTVHRTNDRLSAPRGNQCSISHFLASLGAQEDWYCTHIAHQCWD